MQDDNLDDTLLEPEIFTVGSPEFNDGVDALYMIARHGKPKAAKRAAKTLRDLVKQLGFHLDNEAKKVKDLETRLRDLFHRFALGVPFADLPGAIIEPPPSHLATGGAGGEPTCVINEHAHGDDSHESPWAHTDPAVDAKLKEEPTPMPAPIEERQVWPACEESPAVSDEAPPPVRSSSKAR